MIYSDKIGDYDGYIGPKYKLIKGVWCMKLPKGEKYDILKHCSKYVKKQAKDSDKFYMNYNKVKIGGSDSNRNDLAGPFYEKIKKNKTSKKRKKRFS